MATNLNSLLIDFDSSWSEVETIISMAINVAPDSASPDDDKYNSLCRVAVVLICARNEGFVKELFKAYFDDINENIEFSEIKQTFIINSFQKYYDSETKFINFYEEILNQHKLTLNYEEFLKADDHRPVKGSNITAGYITKVARKVGYDSFLKSLGLSDFKKVFENNKSDNEKQYKDIVEYVIENSSVFPYTYDVQEFKIVEKLNDNVKTSGLWEGFLEDIIIKRNQIAHGISKDNPVTYQQLNEYLLKSKLLSLALTVSLTKHYCQ